MLSALSLNPLVRSGKDHRGMKVIGYLIEAQVARVCGLVLPAWRFACFSPGERSSSGFEGLPLLLGVNLDLRRADMELVVEELRIDEVSEGFLSEVEDWWEDIVSCVVVDRGGWVRGAVISFD